MLFSCQSQLWHGFIFDLLHLALVIFLYLTLHLLEVWIHIIKISLVNWLVLQRSLSTWLNGCVCVLNDFILWSISNLWRWSLLLLSLLVKLLPLWLLEFFLLSHHLLLLGKYHLLLPILSSWWNFSLLVFSIRNLIVIKAHFAHIVEPIHLFLLLHFLCLLCYNSSFLKLRLVNLFILSGNVHSSWNRISIESFQLFWVGFSQLFILLGLSSLLLTLERLDLLLLFLLSQSPFVFLFVDFLLLDYGVHLFSGSWYTSSLWLLLLIFCHGCVPLLAKLLIHLLRLFLSEVIGVRIRLVIIWEIFTWWLSVSPCIGRGSLLYVDSWRVLVLHLEGLILVAYVRAAHALRLASHCCLWLWVVSAARLGVFRLLVLILLLIIWSSRLEILL